MESPQFDLTEYLCGRLADLLKEMKETNPSDRYIDGQINFIRELIQALHPGSFVYIDYTPPK